MQGGRDLPSPLSFQEVTPRKRKAFHGSLEMGMKINNAGYIKPDINNFQPLMYYKTKND